MLGTIVNTVAIIVGSLLGFLLKGSIGFKTLPDSSRGGPNVGRRRIINSGNRT